ncbi:hypothetical protein JCM8547_000006 [Rhodosporidiobolus lusitaniae]
MSRTVADEIELAAPSPARTTPALSRSTSDASFTSSKITPSRAPSIALATLHGVSVPPTGVIGELSGRSSPVEEPALRLRRMSMGEDENEGGEELPPVDKGRGAWMFVAAAFVLETFIWGFSYSFASVLIFLQTHDPWQKESLAALSAVGTVLMAIQFMAPCVIVPAFRRYPDWVKTALWVSVFVNCLSMLVASWASKVWHLLILQSILGGVSGAVLYAPVLLWLNSWWHYRRGLASGIIFAGTGIGGLAFPFILSALLSHGGWATMCRAWAGITFGVYSISVWAMRPRVPPRKPKGGVRGPWLGGVDWKFLTDPVVLVMALTSIASSLSTFPVNLYLPTYALSLTTPHNSDLVVSLYNLSSSIGSLWTGWLSDRSLPLTTAILGVAGAVLALTAWGFANSLGLVFAFAVLFAFFTQICSVWSAAARDAAGSNPNTATMIFTLFGIFRGISSIVGPYISTTLYDPPRSGSTASEDHWGRFGFSRVIIFVGCMSAVSAFGGIGLKWAKGVNARRRAATSG